MARSAEELVELKQRRKRRLLSIVAVLTPIVVVGGGAAWFIRSYVMPATVRIAEPVVAAQDVTTTASISQETTGIAPEAPNWPPIPVRQSPAAVVNSVWDAVPLPGRSTQAFAAEQPAFAVNEPVASPVPLPPQRPRAFVAVANEAVPLPRPRP